MIKYENSVGFDEKYFFYRIYNLHSESQKLKKSLKKKITIVS